MKVKMNNLHFRVFIFYSIINGEFGFCVSKQMKCKRVCFSLDAVKSRCAEEREKETERKKLWKRSMICARTACRWKSNYNLFIFSIKHDINSFFVHTKLWESWNKSDLLEINQAKTPSSSEFVTQMRHNWRPESHLRLINVRDILLEQPIDDAIQFVQLQSDNRLHATWLPFESPQSLSMRSAINGRLGNASTFEMPIMQLRSCARELEDNGEGDDDKQSENHRHYAIDKESFLLSVSLHFDIYWRDGVMVFSTPSPRSHCFDAYRSETPIGNKSFSAQ